MESKTVKKDDKCPECEHECECAGRRITMTGSMNTDWYGKLRWFKCRCCGAKLVSQDGGELEIAAP